MDERGNELGVERRDEDLVQRADEFVIDVPLFEGPFRVLAGLILEQRFDVCDVPVARITDRFLARGLDEMRDWSLEEATWFVAVCATLLELKVGRLLPRAVVEAEEDLLGASPDLAYARSLELGAFRRIAEEVSRMMAEASLSVPRGAGPPPEYAHLYPDILEKVTPDDLRTVAAGLLTPPRDLDLSHVTPIRVSLADALAQVRDRLVLQQEARFSELAADCRERIEVVVRFLALLELHREGKVELEQAELFGDIRVRWQEGAADASEAQVEVLDLRAAEQGEGRAPVRMRSGRGGGVE